EEGHAGPTYEVSPALKDPTGQTLNISILDGADGPPVPAQVRLFLDGALYVPDAVGGGGLRFTTIHQGKKQRATVLYATGNGFMVIPLPATPFQQGELVIAKGYG